MTDIAENLSLLGRRAYEQASPFRKRLVVAVPDEYSVSIDVGDGLTEDVPCLASYIHRAAGDRVWMVMTDERGWLVLGKIGPPDTDSAIPLPLPAPFPADDTSDDQAGSGEDTGDPDESVPVPDSPSVLTPKFDPPATEEAAGA